MGPNQLSIASGAVYPVYVLMFLTGILSWPISKMLDCCLGAHGAAKRYNNDELKAIVKIHSEQALKELSKNSHTEIEENTGL